MKREKNDMLILMQIRRKYSRLSIFFRVRHAGGKR